MLQLHLPLPLLSLNFLGFGIDVTYSRDGAAHAITVCATFAVGCWSKHFRFGGGNGGAD